MSLLDAMLLDPFRDPREIYISLRTDGQHGSGTINDPYDGSTQFGPSLAGNITCNPLEFVVDAGTGIVGLAHGSSVSISGVRGPAADWDLSGTVGLFNETFTVAEILEWRDGSPIRFTLLLSGVPTAPPIPQYSAIKFTFGALTLGESSPQIRIFWPVAKVTTQQPHGFVGFEGVNIDEITDSTIAQYGGEYPIVARDTYSFRYRLSFMPPGLSSRCRVRRLIHRLDEVMRGVPLYSIIHLGPGMFNTRGFVALWRISPGVALDLSVGFELRSGQRLIGGGIGVTILRLVLPIDELQGHIVVGSEGANYTEVADLTVDCNGPEHSTPYNLVSAPVTCAGVVLNGTFNRVQRVRVINFCVQAGPECFGIFHSGSFDTHSYTPVWSIIDDCILEKPSENNTHETTLASLQGNHVNARGASLIQRNTYHNCEYSNGLSNHPIPLRQTEGLTSESKTIDGNLVYFAVLTTTEAHTHLKGKALVVNGVTEGGLLSTIYNGAFAIEEVVAPTVLKYRLYGPPAGGAIGTANASIGGTLSNEWLTIEPLNKPSPGSEKFTLRTKRPHNRVVGQTVLINNVAPTDPPHLFNGTFKVVEVNSAVDLTCKILKPPVSFPDFKFNNAFIGPNFYGRGAQGGTGCVTEGNAFLNCTVGCYHDTGSTRDFVYRDNYLSKIARGVFFNFDADASVEAPARNVSALLFLTGNGRIAVCTTSLPHGLREGEAINIRGARIDGELKGLNAKSYNGTFSVLQIASDSVFYYAMEATQTENADPPDLDNPISLQARWQVRRMVFEANQIYFNNFDSKTADLLAGISSIGYGGGPPYMFPQAVFRENLFQLADNAPALIRANGTSMVACRLTSFENAIVESNCISILDDYPLNYINSANITAFNNLTPTGESVALFQQKIDTFKRISLLEDLVNDAQNFALL